MKIKDIFMKEDEILKIHNVTVEILSKVGVNFFSEKALDLFKKNGAKVVDNRVFIDEELLTRALSTVPEKFTLKGKDKNIEIGGDNTIFVPASGPVFSMKGKDRKECTSEDFINFTKLVESSNVIDVINPNMIEPQDMPTEKRRNFQMAASLKYGTKPMLGFTTSPEASRESINMVQDFYGKKEDNQLLGLISPISPLTYDDVMLEAMFIYAENSQPLMIACCSLPGATSPVTISGTLAVNNAEVLAGIVLSQLIKPGLGVIYGNTSGSCDLRYATPAIGGVETSLITAAVAALTKHYKIPSRSGGSLTDAKAIDMQAGVESTITILPTIMSGINFVFQSCGILDSFNVLSYEKFVLDEQTIRMLNRWSEGFEITDELIGSDVIEKIGPGGQYLEEMHTMRHFRGEHLIPKLFNKVGFEAWEMNGAVSVEEHASQEVEKRLNSFEEPTLSDKQNDLLKNYI
jgi:trimethylamine--corrinoid protein Co-methyltransferase